MAAKPVLLARVRDAFVPGTLPLRAAALTYYTFLALVPLMALSLGLLEGLGLTQFSLQVRRFFLSELGVVHDASVSLGSLLSRAETRAVVSLSGLLFLVSTTALLVNIESALDEIFGAGTRRPVRVRALRYLALFALGPLGLGGSLLMTALWRGTRLGHAIPIGGFTLVAGPLTLALGSLWLLYRFVPNAQVSAGAAALGALAAAPTWELAKQIYATVAIAAYQHNAAIYGPLAAVPVLLLWIQLSWVIVLLGARLGAAVQR